MTFIFPRPTISLFLSFRNPQKRTAQHQSGQGLVRQQPVLGLVSVRVHSWLNVFLRASVFLWLKIPVPLRYLSCLLLNPYPCPSVVKKSVSLSRISYLS